MSPAEVAARVIAGLIDVAAVRAESMDRLRALVTAVVDELDPDRKRNTDPTWTQTLDPWVRLDPLDRLRLAHDDLMILEGQADSIVIELRSMLTPTSVGSGRRPMPMTPARAHRLLCDLADRRSVYLDRMGNAERRVRARLAPETSAELRRALRQVREEEDRGRQHRDRLRTLLEWSDGPALTRSAV